MEQVLRPVALQYRPELVLVSAGFDISRGDPLADMDVTARGFARMTAALIDISASCCPGRLGFLLEGGYGLQALAGGVEAVLQTLAAGEDVEAEVGPSGSVPGARPGEETVAVIAAVRRALAPRWRFD